ncbi:MAG: chromosome segregation protein SMC [Ruminococcaceae bacterium]|nr:chromosome segregation protein SMC [Oscillospiraceae bacterium]
MYLKTLELHGFKSFPEKTVLHFNSGTTVIVGPNGSGKSNITDAMRWVLGELSTKNIRGSKMEDVIFVGADGRSPMGFAEVSVTFDDTEEPRRLNSPYDVITVTRRYYRAGESEYFINRKPCRLRDIYELFMNTGIGREGYSIIGQGKIAEIISKKSDDRRGIFEETAGITKYRYKKHESQKKLAETEANMVRITDIYTEIESRIGPLERDAKKARRYLELYGEKKDLDIALWLYDMEKLKADIEKTHSDCVMSRHELEMADDTKSRYEAQNERLYSASQENKAESQKLYEDIREKTTALHELENSFRVLENDVVHTSTTISALESENENTASVIDAEKAHIAELKANLEEAKTLFAEKEKELSEKIAEKDSYTAAEKELQAEIENKLIKLRAKESELGELTVRLNVLKNTLSDQNKRGETIDADIKLHSEELEKMEKSAADAAYTSEAYEASMASLREEISALVAKAYKADDDERALREDLSSVSAEIGALESRIGALKRMSENFDGYNNSVKYVMTEASEGRLKGIYGPVSHLISTEDKYIIAVETALGANMQNIIVENEASAKNAMYSLKREKAGRATFYPLSTVRPRPLAKEIEAAADYDGFVDYASELVKYDSAYANVMEYLLSGIPVFDNIDNATEMARSQRWKVRAVTLDGQQVNAGGSFTGGSARRDSGVLSRNSHINKLTSDMNGLISEKKDIEAEIAGVEETIKSIANERASVEERLSITDTLYRTELSVRDELNAKIDVKKALIEGLKSDAESISEQNRQGTEDIEKLEEKCRVLTAECEAVSAERVEDDIKAGEFREKSEIAAEEIAALQITMTEFRKDAETAERLVLESGEKSRSYENEIEARLARIASLREKISASENEIAEKKELAKELSEQLAASETKRTQLEEGGMDYERRLNEIRHKLNEISSKKEILFVANAKNEHKLENLTTESEKMTTRLWDEYELTATVASALELPEVTPAGRPEMARRLSELKSSIKALGHVNPDAIEEYAEQKERYEYLKSQIEDLTKSREELEKIISSIESEMKTMFEKTFHEVNRNFKEVFAELFGGGSAELTLTDPDNILTSGIEISAAPPGKMIKNLSLLSGGEQAFVAIALLFALIKVNPSPFCIFDEIEAALDEVNVSRVANYVKRYSKELQMIVISHRRGMMEVADSLYGVTMPRRGISKVFVLDVDSVSEKTMTDNSFVE